MLFSLAKDLVAESREILNDKVSAIYRWSDSELLGYLNSGIARAVLLRPDLFGVREAVTLVAGVKQSLPANGVVFLSVQTTNDGSVPKETTLDALNGLLPTWENSTATDNMSLFAKSPVLGEWYCYPAANADATADIFYAKTPDPATIDGVDGETVDSAVAVDSRFDEALVSYVVYRGLSKEVEEGNEPVGESYLNKYFAVFGGQ